MNRRKALKRIAAGLILAGAAGGGYTYYRLNRNPPLSSLKKHHDLLNAIAETIIPTTPDSPGAAQTDAGGFMIVLLTDCTDRKSLNRFLYGLDDLISYTHRHYNKDFAKCSEAEREKILLHFEEKGRPWKGVMGKIQHRIMGSAFFTTLKEYTIIAYCTSQDGAQQGLSYIAVPGHFSGCIPLGKEQRAWATA